MDNTTIKKNFEDINSYIEDLEKRNKVQCSEIKTLIKQSRLIGKGRDELRSKIRSQYQNINDIDLRKIDFAYSGLLDGKVTSEVEGGRFIEEETFDNYNAMLRYLNDKKINLNCYCE